MTFVDTVKKDGKTYDIHDTTGRVRIEGTNLVIPEQKMPEPLISIDGTDYYHKCEFDLTKFTLEDSGKFDLLTGLAYTEEPSSSSMTIAIYGPNYPVGSNVLLLNLNDSLKFVVYVIANGTSVPASVDYTSRAFTCVDTKIDVTDNTKICLPTCSAYYGWLSEDGKTFISYFNLKGEPIPERITSVKQGETIIPIGQSGGGAQLYRHNLVLHTTYGDSSTRDFPYSGISSSSSSITTVVEMASAFQQERIQLYHDSSFSLYADQTTLIIEDVDASIICAGYPGAVPYFSGSLKILNIALGYPVSSTQQDISLTLDSIEDSVIAL